MAKEGVASFEIPTEMRDFAEKSLAQAKQAFDSFSAAAQHAVNTAETQATTARSGAKEVTDLAGRFIERNIASSFDFAKKLVQARDSSEVMDLHGEYVKTQIATLTDQAKELSKQAAKTAEQRKH